MATINQGPCTQDTDPTSAMPDSTTKERSGFSEGEDVLVQQKDGRFYFGTVVMVELNNERCLVKFGDNTQRWSKFKDITRLSMSGSEQPSCVVCKKSKSGTNSRGLNNEIVQCDKCGRGYHQLCHQPAVASTKDGFVCQRCTVPATPPPKFVRPGAARKQGSQTCKGNEALPCPPLKLPYDLNVLTWDLNHRTNSEQKYCYCGKPGEWYMQMVQCGRCRQWFHENCLRCLQFPLYCGDRFYVFVCAVCNEGEEFIRRLELGWVDLVHVALYNLTVIYAKKYYDLDTMIVPYINERWEEWQLPSKLLMASMKERRDQILSVLQNDKIRFKCGREIKKRTSIWGLRNRMPPFAPSFSLPVNGIVDDEVLKRLCEGNRRLRFLSPGTGGGSRSPMFRLPPTLTETPPALNGEMDLPLPNSPATTPPVLTPEGKKEVISEAMSPDEGNDSEDDFQPSPRQKRARQCQVERERRRKRWREQHRRAGLRLLGGRKQSQKVSSSSTSLLLNSASSKHESKDSDLSLMIAKKARKLVKNAISKGHLKKVSSLSSECQSSVQTATCPTPTSDDEGSSRGTLDHFIPPLKDFEGANNPFSTSTPSSPPLPAPPLPPSAPPPQQHAGRPAKRQLSEQDIRIGKNGEVKRRRFRRRNGLSTSKIPASNIYNRLKHDPTLQDTVRLRPAYQRSSKLASQTPLPVTPVTSRSGSTCVADALNSGRLRSNSADTPPSPQVSTPEQVSYDEIKSSLNHYFGAANRIASGENFKVLARRVLASGKVQFLLEWDSPAS